MYSTNKSGQWLTSIIDNDQNVGNYCSLALIQTMDYMCLISLIHVNSLYMLTKLPVQLTLQDEALLIAQVENTPLSP